MSATVAAAVKAAIVILSNEEARKKVGWGIVAILSPLIVLVVLLCAILSGTSQHNVSAVELCFHGGSISASATPEYQRYIEDTALTVEQGVRFLESHILPHQNRSILKNRADEIAMQFQSVLAKNNRQGIRTQAEKKEVASAWLELAISCAKVPVKYEADEIKRRQKEEKTQRETEPVMA